MRIKTIDAIRRRLTSSELVPKFAAIDTPVGKSVRVAALKLINSDAWEPGRKRKEDIITLIF